MSDARPSGGPATRATRASSDKSAVVATLVCAVVLVVLARGDAWTADDAFIAFRYLDNLLGGRGLVYNTGERVEGFSSLLFLVLLAPARAAGVSPVVAANALGVACSLFELWLLVRVVRRSTSLVWAPAFAGVLFATDRIVSVWATGGLETAMHGMLVFAAFSISIDRARCPVVGRAAMLHVLLAASRPEGLAFYPLHLALLVRAGWHDGSWRASLRRSLNVFLPGVAVLAAARYAYYGSIVANPYRAKVEGVPGTWAFGAGYVQAFAHRMGWLGGAHVLAWAVLVAAAIWAWRSRSKRNTSDAPDAPDARTALEPLFAAIAYVAVGIAVIVPMGGDYMSDFRFLRPVMGLIAFAVAFSVALVVGGARGVEPSADLVTRRRLGAAGIVVALALLVSHALRQREGSPIFWDVTPARDHKRSLELTEDEARRFKIALFQFAEAGDSLLSDKSGYMGYGHTLRTIDATGLLSKDIDGDFYLRPEWSEGGPRERFPGHARWPKVEFMQRERLTVIFPKISKRSPNEAEIGPRSPRRHREYPFLHVTVPLANGEFLRFFTTLTAEQLAARATRRKITVCWRSALGSLACAGPKP